jgi:ketosteroid isomerase-like protein
MMLGTATLNPTCTASKPRLQHGRDFMRPAFFLAMIGGAMLSACSMAPPHPDNATLVRQVQDTERAFARTMAARDHAAFATFLSKDAIFFSGDKTLRGATQVADAWKPYYEGANAPFSWEPDRVEVLDSGTLALSTGPVRDPQGHVTGRFNSIWRLEAQGTWRIVFDKGSPVCGTGTH